ncbi:MAG TPA: TPM domain-containing protein [Balneolaceae bacterium]|nr:TPM domain-containing protein [Balneolaceae bacterium]
MASNEFLTKKDEQRIVEAIQKAEHQTSGEIRIHIEENCDQEPLVRAARIFHELGMDHTELQNGVLIYIASEDKKAAVYAGKGIHKQVEEGFWDDVLNTLVGHFKNQAFADGIEQAILKVGNKLVELFPHQKGDVNELSNEISYNNPNS